MTEQVAIQELLMSGNANVQLSVSGKDLREFGESLNCIGGNSLAI